MAPLDLLLPLLVLGFVLAPSASAQGLGVFDLAPEELENHINNPAQLEYYLKCVTGDDGSCDARGLQLRRIMPELSLVPQIGVVCRVCKPRELVNLRRIVYVLQTRYPVCWVNLNEYLNYVRVNSVRPGFKPDDKSRNVVDCTRKSK
ncbi:uncharacterized protein LOC143036908 [Oratosquilla oratoria]|uniref:uncharacterized protein LOC143036908 n=1 Tax=Oratosquilla oratoria TaxID=337810 RepID=UPI003F76FAA9